MDKQDNVVPLNVHPLHPKARTMSCYGDLHGIVLQLQQETVFKRLYTKG